MLHNITGKPNRTYNVLVQFHIFFFCFSLCFKVSHTRCTPRLKGATDHTVSNVASESSLAFTNTHTHIYAGVHHTLTSYRKKKKKKSPAKLDPCQLEQKQHKILEVKQKRLHPPAVGWNTRRPQMASGRQRPLHIMEVGKFQQASYGRRLQKSLNGAGDVSTKMFRTPHPCAHVPSVQKWGRQKQWHMSQVLCCRVVESSRFYWCRR